MTSIRRRILLPLAPLIGLALALTGFGIERSVKSDLLRGLDRTLLVLAHGVGSAVEVELDGGLEFEVENLEVLEFSTAERTAFYQVEDDGGTILFRSATAPKLEATHNQGEPTYRYLSLQGLRYRLCTLAVIREVEDFDEDIYEWKVEHPGEPIPTVEPRRFWITVGHSTAPVDTTIAVLRSRLLGALGSLFLVLILLPTWIVTRALHPLRKISRQADEVGPQAPERRLDEHGIDREVQSLTRALNRALDRLAEAYTRQRRFTADAAHELRTPLTILRTNCEVTLRRERSVAELQQALESVHRSVLRMGQLVEDLLALSHLQAESELADRSDVDLAAVAGEAVSLHASAAAMGGVELRVEATTPVRVRGHSGLITECVSNLVENAIRHTPAGGSVTVSVHGGDEPQVRVHDTGEGIAEEHLGKIFERFYRADKSRSREKGGTGLGLALVAEIARIHGGRVEVSSRLGEGSCFTLYFPGV